MAEQEAWTPAFPGQRAPWAPGNEWRVGAGNQLAVTHGAYSEKRIAPLAAEIEAMARADRQWPAYLDDTSYLPAVRAWAHAEAVCELLRRHVAGLSIDEMLSDRTEESSTEHHNGGTTTRSTKGRRTVSALTLLDRWEGTASRHRSRLGLDPLSRARLGKDITAAQVDLVTLLTAERERHDGQSLTAGTSTPHLPDSAATPPPHRQETP